MGLKVNLTYEEKKAIHVQRMELVDEKTEFAWVCKFTDDQLDNIYAGNFEKIENGEAFIHDIHQMVYERVRAKMPKEKVFKPSMLESLPEAVLMITAKVMELSGLDKVKVKQTKLVMPAKTEKKK